MGLWGSCRGLLMVTFLTNVPPSDPFRGPAGAALSLCLSEELCCVDWRLMWQ